MLTVWLVWRLEYVFLKEKYHRSFYNKCRVVYSIQNNLNSISEVGRTQTTEFVNLESMYESWSSVD
jgi:hypothetical protein